MSLDSTIVRIIKDEGFRSKPYKDTLGVLTFGHGLTFITDSESAAIVQKRVSDLINLTVPKYWPDVLNNETVVEVLAEMVYQMGVRGVQGFRRMLRALEAGEYRKAADEMLDSQWHQQTKLRCERAADRIRALET